MTIQCKLTVTLCWRADAERETTQMSCSDQSPQELIPKLVKKIGLPTVDQAGDPIVYKLRLDDEQGPVLKSRDLLSQQSVSDGSRLWLAPQLSQDIPAERCILQLPDGSEIVVAPRGQGLTRSWLLRFVELHNPAAHRRELERIARQQSAYCYVSDHSPHCLVHASEKGYWVVMTDRSDVVTEWSAEREFERLPHELPQQLYTCMRLRLGGVGGLEIGVTIV